MNKHINTILTGDITYSLLIIAKNIIKIYFIFLTLFIFQYNYIKKCGEKITKVCTVYNSILPSIFYFHLFIIFIHV